MMDDRHKAKILRKKKEAQENAQQAEENLHGVAEMYVPQSKEHVEDVLRHIVKVALSEGWAEPDIHAVVESAARDFREWLAKPLPDSLA